MCILQWTKCFPPTLFKESKWKQAIKSQDFSLCDTMFAINKQDSGL